MTFVQTPALALLPGVMHRLAETAPDLRVEVVQSETAPALDDLRLQAVDLVVGYEPVSSGAPPNPTSLPSGSR
jgi:DNA-binding transcriptional LysR family regulator